MGNSKKSNMLVYAHYYHPDVASTGQILKELCEGLRIGLILLLYV